ncbi:MAG: hypothetical protein P4L81_04715, partial [Candidatus Pacebacteria bacterium]|nr:hypothetical protein [Candidatus Paceibacterota bacterium]
AKTACSLALRLVRTLRSLVETYTPNPRFAHSHDILTVLGRTPRACHNSSVSSEEFVALHAGNRRAM